MVDEDTKGLIVDQTIEKVSFCAPDRNHDHGFSYICRDGTTRRWMCHGFLAVKDTGERLSHAVGCAFAVCLERKQRRDKECGVTMTFNLKNSTFTRTGSFRNPKAVERLTIAELNTAIVSPHPKQSNPFAIERPRASPHLLERQCSFRGFQQIGTASPFKRQMSLRVNDLPSNISRQRSYLTSNSSNFSSLYQGDDLRLPPKEKKLDALCKELSIGLTLLGEDQVDDTDIKNNASFESNATDDQTMSNRSYLTLKTKNITNSKTEQDFGNIKSFQETIKDSKIQSSDPFDADWVITLKKDQINTNPFLKPF